MDAMRPDAAVGPAAIASLLRDVMRVVVTGASGFLGRAALAHFRKAGADVIGVHRQPAAAPGEVTVNDYAQAPGGDVLIHLAENGDRSKVARLGPRFASDVEDRLRRLLDGRYRRVVYASSSLVYVPSDRPRRVGDAVSSAEHYAAGKLACEKLVRDVGGTVLRFSNLYGPGQTGETVINAIQMQLPGGGPVVLRDIAPIRDFLAVRDAAAALGAVIGLREPAILNIGTGVATSIGGLARLFLELNGTPDREVTALQSGSPTGFVLDIEETTARTGWRPTVELRQGLADLFVQA
jgi:nucleoside-diphosphate-sugar epimerase